MVRCDWSRGRGGAYSALLSGAALSGRGSTALGTTDCGGAVVSSVGARGGGGATGAIPIIVRLRGANDGFVGGELDPGEGTATGVMVALLTEGGSDGASMGAAGRTEGGGGGIAATAIAGGGTEEFPRDGEGDVAGCDEAAAASSTEGASGAVTATSGDGTKGIAAASSSSGPSGTSQSGVNRSARRSASSIEIGATLEPGGLSFSAWSFPAIEGLGRRSFSEPSG